MSTGPQSDRVSKGVQRQDGAVRTPPLPPWPASAPAQGLVILREVAESDVEMARELSTDPYVPQTGSLPPHATVEDARAWIYRQQARHAEGAGFSFTITESGSGTAVGHCGLWLRELAQGRGSAGYSIAPSWRGRGLASDALGALTTFAWTVPGLERIALFIEPWNYASIRTAERAGYVYQDLLPEHQKIGGERRDVLLYLARRPAAPQGAALGG